MTSPALAPATAAIGACLGSFVTTAAVRAGRGEQAWVGRSHCEACGVALGYVDTVPLVSFVRLRGACAACGASIDPAHILGEAVGAAVLGLTFLTLPALQAGMVSTLGLALLGAAVVDAKTRGLPDVLTLVVGACALGLAKGVDSFIAGVTAALLTFVVLEGCRRSFAASKGRAGLGFGDVKLAAALALWLGVATPFMVIAASLGGLCFYGLARPRDPRIPFGPFLGASAWIIGFAREAHWWPSPI